MVPKQSENFEPKITKMVKRNQLRKCKLQKKIWEKELQYRLVMESKEEEEKGEVYDMKSSRKCPNEIEGKKFCNFENCRAHHSM